MWHMWRTQMVSLGKMIESSFTFSFDDYKLHAQKEQSCGDFFGIKKNLRVVDETQVAQFGRGSAP